MQLLPFILYRCCSIWWPKSKRAIKYFWCELISSWVQHKSLCNWNRQWCGCCHQTYTQTWKVHRLKLVVLVFAITFSHLWRLWLLFYISVGTPSALLQRMPKLLSIFYDTLTGKITPHSNICLFLAHCLCC